MQGAARQGNCRDRTKETDLPNLTQSCGRCAPGLLQVHVQCAVWRWRGAGGCGTQVHSCTALTSGIRHGVARQDGVGGGNLSPMKRGGPTGKSGGEKSKSWASYPTPLKSQFQKSRRCTSLSFRNGSVRILSVRRRTDVSRGGWENPGVELDLEIAA